MDGLPAPNSIYLEPSIASRREEMEARLESHLKATNLEAVFSIKVLIVNMEITCMDTVEQTAL